MSKIGTLAPTSTSTFDLSYLPQFLQVGGTGSSSSLLSLTVIARGRTLIQITDANAIDALQKIENNLVANPMTGVYLGKRFFLSDGRIEGQSTVTVENGGVSPLEVYGNSAGKSLATMARSIAVTPVVSSGNVTFADFDVLLFDASTVDRVQVTFENGFTEEMNPAEIQGMYAALDQTEADGTVSTKTVLMGYRAPKGFAVKQAVIYNNGTGNTNVVVSKWIKL